MWENRVLVVEEADVISRYHRTARVSSTEAGYCFATYFFTSVISNLYTEHILHVIMSNFKPDVQLNTEYNVFFILLLETHFNSHIVESSYVLMKRPHLERQTAKQSVFLRIQVRASSQTKGLERG